MSAYDCSFNKYEFYLGMYGNSSTSVETKPPEFLLKNEKDSAYSQIGNKRRFISKQLRLLSSFFVIGRIFLQTIKELPLSLPTKIGIILNLVDINICLSQKKHLELQQNNAVSKAHFWSQFTPEKIDERLAKYNSQKTKLEEKTPNNDAAATIIKLKIKIISKKIENWEKLNKDFSSLDPGALNSFKKAKVKRWETKHEGWVIRQQMRNSDIKKNGFSCLTSVFISALASSGFGFITIFSTSIAAAFLSYKLFSPSEKALKLALVKNDVTVLQRKSNSPKIKDLFLRPPVEEEIFVLDLQQISRDASIENQVDQFMATIDARNAKKSEDDQFMMKKDLRSL